MVAAEITPSVVQKTYIPSIGSRGTAMKLVKYTFKVAKATDGDWISTADVFQTGTPIMWNAVTIDGSSNGVQEGTVGMAYTNTSTLLTLSGGTVGTTYGEIYYEE